ncbi:MAG: ABC transporter substrate-binding protein [Gemmatimonadota bacterium]
MRRVSARRVTGFMLVTLLVGACGESPPRDQGAPGWTSSMRTEPEVPEAQRYGGVIVVAGRGDPVSMNSLVSTDFESEQHQVHVLFVTLVSNDDDYEPQPYFAHSWEFDSDTSEVVFHLRHDLQWHDGTPVTSRDVAFTFERLKNPAVPFPNPAYFDYWDAAEVIDPVTIRFFLRPHANALYGWTRTAIMPEHILGEVPPEDLESHPFGTLSPVGNGPFRFVERIPGDRWVFEANLEFPEELGGRPYVDRLIYRQIPDEFALAAALQTGEVDLVIDASPPMLDQVGDDPEVVSTTYSAPEYAFIAWNSKRPEFANPLVRRALTMAIDRETLVQAVLGGHGTVAPGPVGPWHWAYDSTWAPLPYSPEEAGALLDEAGWTDSDGDGARDRNGEPFSFELLATPRRDWGAIQTLVQASLGQIGVEVEPVVREQGALIPLVIGADRRFDAVIIGWARDVPLNDVDLWACDQVGQPFQFTSYCNPELDVVLDSIPLEADRARLRSLIGRYHELVVEDQPYTFLYYLDRVDLARARVYGANMDSRGDWVNVARWWVYDDSGDGR